MPDVAEPAAVLTDVFHVGGRKYIRPLVIGLTNRHSVLVDFERNRLAAWWVGDTARQRVAGKTWFWEPGGTHLFPPHDGENELVLVHNGHDQRPMGAGQFAAELDWWEHEAVALRFGYRLRFAGTGDAASSPVVLQITQAIAPSAADATRPADALSTSGFRRRFEIVGVPAGEHIRLRALPGEVVTVEEDGRAAVCKNAAGRPRARIASPASARFDVGGSTILPSAAEDKQPVVCELEYACDLPVDRYPVALPPEPSPPLSRLNVVPGFECVRLPLPGSEMPTALAWRQDGTLVFTSLKGQAFLRAIPMATD